MSIRDLPGSKGWPVHEADNLTAICGSLDVSQAYGPPWPVRGIGLPFTFTFFHFEDHTLAYHLLLLLSCLVYSGSKSKPKNKPAEEGEKVSFNPEDGGSILLRNVGLSLNYVVLQPRILHCA
jgi:hypothetical protein